MPIPDDDPQILLDRFLLVLWDALHFDMCLEWTRLGVTNLPVDHTLELGRWFALGLTTSAEPIFSGMCAMCAL